MNARRADQLSDPVARSTIQARLNATDEQWNKLEPYLTRFEGPGELEFFDWPSVIATLRQLALVKKGDSMSFRFENERTSADRLEKLARDSGVFVRREGNIVYINGPILYPAECGLLRTIACVND